MIEIKYVRNSIGSSSPGRVGVSAGPTLSTMPSPAETNPLPEVRSALLHRVPHRLEGERDFATVQPSQRDVDGLCARTSAEGKGDSHGSHLRKSLHHHPDLHDHGSQVSHG